MWILAFTLFFLFITASYSVDCEIDSWIFYIKNIVADDFEIHGEINISEVGAGLIGKWYT